MRFGEPMLPTPYTVTRIRRETHDTFTMELEPTGGAQVHSFAAGQFNMLYVFGIGEVPISISGDPAKPLAIVHTIRAVGAVTKAMDGVKLPAGATWELAGATQVTNDVFRTLGVAMLIAILLVYIIMAMHRASPIRISPYM